jgi:phosphoglycolate phosphatase-like HAD superfamily hydrolase
MTMGIEIEGLDDAMEQLNEMKERAEELEGEHEVPFNELYNRSFMEGYSRYSSFDAMLEDGGFEVDTEKDFEQILEEELNSHIRNNTSFASWEEMQETAVQEWTAKKMGRD